MIIENAYQDQKIRTEKNPGIVALLTNTLGVNKLR